MARIKPQTLLLQSKKKKAPSRISLTTILFGLMVMVLLVMCGVATYRHWSQRLSIQVGTGLSNYSENNSEGDHSKVDVPGFATFVTSKGKITVELYKENSPEIVDKFIDLCQRGYFKGMPFHRVIKNYVIQVGDSGSAEDWTLKAKHPNVRLNSKYELHNSDIHILPTLADHLNNAVLSMRHLCLEPQRLDKNLNGSHSSLQLLLYLI